MKFKSIIVYFLVAIMLCCSLPASAYGFKMSEGDCYLSNNHYNSTDNDCIKKIEASQSTRALLNGCDTRVQINTAAKLSTLINNGSYAINFVGRYLQNASSTNPKKITPTELKLLSGASIAIVSLYQLSGSDASYFTYQKGVNQATDAISCATAIGQPNGKPIYFCVDFWPANNSEYQSVLNYFAGVNSVLSKSSTNPKGYKMGAYGCSTVLKRLRTSYPNVKTMLWGTTNCYDGTSFTNWNIKQNAPQVLIGSGSNAMYIDVDHAYSTSYGAWQHTHKYPSTWSNFGSPAEHRRKCIYCNGYKYQSHVQDPRRSGCIVCGYSGVIAYPQSPGVTVNAEQGKRPCYCN